jgi:predicted peroxiredoxin
MSANANRFVVTLNCSHDNPDRATVAFVVANAALGSDRDTLVFLSVEGVRLAIHGEAGKIHEHGFAPLADLMQQFTENGGKILVCSPCFKKRALEESALIPGAVIAGGAKLVEFMAGGVSSVSY